MFSIPDNAEPLYKFYSFSPRNLEALSEPYVWFSRLESFNDPFEGVVREVEISEDSQLLNMMKSVLAYSEKISKIEAEEILLRNLLNARNETLAYCKEKANSLKKAAQENIERLGYFCLFRNNTERSAHEQLLMWSHYSDGLRGMRVTFDANKLLNSLNVAQAAIAASPIKYVEEPPTVSVLDYLGLIEEPTTIEKCASIIFNRVTCKNKAWEYEQEYRLITPNSGSVKYSPSAVKEIAFGEKMPDSQKRVIYKLFKAHNTDTKFKTAKISRCNYTIELEEYHPHL